MPGLKLAKTDGPYDLEGITKLEVGAGWDQTSGGTGGLFGKLKRAAGCDLDLIAILMNGADPVRYAGMDSLDPLGDGSITHSGDNTTGKGAGDDETLTLDLARVKPNVTSVVFMAGAYKVGSSLEKAANVEFNVYDSSGGTKAQVGSYWPPLNTSGNMCAMAKVVRENGTWQLHLIEKMVKVNPGDRRSLLNAAIGL